MGHLIITERERENMSNRQERKARKAAARTGQGEGYFKEAKRPTRPYQSKEDAQIARRVDRAVADQVSQMIAGAAAAAKGVAR